MVTILLIENDSERQHILATVLETEGYSLVVSSNPDIAWVKMVAWENPIDLVLCSSPQERLAEFLKRKYAEKRFCRIPVIFLLKEEKYNQEERQRLPRHQNWAYLPIPFSLHRLLKEMEDLLTRSAC